MLKQSAFRVGLRLGQDTQYGGELRVSRDGALVISDGHGFLYEAASRGTVYAVSTALTGTTVVADNVAPPAAGVATVLSLLNPVGSGVTLEILRGWVCYLSGTPGAGCWAWCGATVGTAITAAPAGTAGGNTRNAQVPSRGRTWTQTVLTGAPAHQLVRPFPTASFAAPLAATTDGLCVVDNVDGALVVTPGNLITLAPPAVGTSVVVSVGIMYAEVPRALRDST
jgi:hypothetical protein